MGERVIIIGASSGIGEALAKYYFFKGAQVAIAARRTDRLVKIASESVGNGPYEIIYEQMDVTSESATAVFEKMIERLGGLDLVIYCSGNGKHIDKLELEEQMESVKVNVCGFMRIAITALNYFLQSDREGGSKGHIVTISSVASVRGLGSSPAYSATKRYQRIYFEALRSYAASKGKQVDFTAILPGFIATDFINRKYPMTMTLDYALKRIVKAIARRRYSKIIDWRWATLVFFMRLIPASLWRRLKY